MSGIKEKNCKDLYSIQHLDLIKTKQKYDPVPIITIDKHTVAYYIGFDNVIILSNPRYDRQSNSKLCYDSEPEYVGNCLLRFESNMKTIQWLFVLTL